MKLLVVHSHFRPGGVRRVIEAAVPHLVVALRPRVRELVLLGGEGPESIWQEALAARVSPVPLRIQIDPSLGYFAEQSGPRKLVRRHVRRCFESVLAGVQPGTCVVWAHNLGLGRNLDVTRELSRLCSALGLPLILHHHDWWFDNRWPRWKEMSAAGLRSLPDAARTILAQGDNVRHAAINQADAAILKRYFPGQAGWLPNPADADARPSVERSAAAARWLKEQIGSEGPCWLLPCRLLRRKNIAEALLITRWLRPEAWLVTTGAVSSRDEQAYAQTLAQAAHQHRWPLRLGLLQGRESGKPSVAELLGASEAVLLTSLLEGFGLPYLEAAAAQRPLVARSLPNIAPDLARFGFRFSHAYDEVWVHPELFDWNAEFDRQTRRFRTWCRDLPRSCRRWVGTPMLLAAGGSPSPVPFSRLTLTAQLEVLTVPPATSWPACAPLNPALGSWRRWAGEQRLQPTVWPAAASRWLSGTSYARRFVRLLKDPPQRGGLAVFSLQAQEHLMRVKLAAHNLYPLLWSTEP